MSLGELLNVLIDDYVSVEVFACESMDSQLVRIEFVPRERIYFPNNTGEADILAWRFDSIFDFSNSVYHTVTINQEKSLMLAIVNLTSESSPFPVEALAVIDSALAGIGLRRQVRSVVVPARSYSITYDGSTMEKTRIEATVAPMAAQYHLTFAVEVEESVSFP